MQKSLLTWAKQQIDSDNEDGKNIAVDLVVKCKEYFNQITLPSCDIFAKQVLCLFRYGADC